MAPLPWSTPFEKLDSTSCFEIVLSGSRSLNFLSILDKFWLTSRVTNRGKARLSGEPCLILLRICFHWIWGGLRSGSLKRQEEVLLCQTSPFCFSLGFWNQTLSCLKNLIFLILQHISIIFSIKNVSTHPTQLGFPHFGFFLGLAGPRLCVPSPKPWRFVWRFRGIAGYFGVAFSGDRNEDTVNWKRRKGYLKKKWKNAKDMFLCVFI